jgi:hypothetical protein
MAKGFEGYSTRPYQYRSIFTPQLISLIQNRQRRNQEIEQRRIEQDNQQKARVFDEALKFNPDKPVMSQYTGEWENEVRNYYAQVSEIKKSDYSPEDQMSLIRQKQFDINRKVKYVNDFDKELKATLDGAQKAGIYNMDAVRQQAAQMVYEDVDPSESIYETAMQGQSMPRLRKPDNLPDASQISSRLLNNAKMLNQAAVVNKWYNSNFSMTANEIATPGADTPGYDVTNRTKKLTAMGFAVDKNGNIKKAEDGRVVLDPNVPGLVNSFMASDGGTLLVNDWKESDKGIEYKQDLLRSGKYKKDSIELDAALNKKAVESLISSHVPLQKIQREEQLREVARRIPVPPSEKTPKPTQGEEITRVNVQNLEELFSATPEQKKKIIKAKFDNATNLIADFVQSREDLKNLPGITPQMIPAEESKDGYVVLSEMKEDKLGRSVVAGYRIINLDDKKAAIDPLVTRYSVIRGHTNVNEVLVEEEFMRRQKAAQESKINAVREKLKNLKK